MSVRDRGEGIPQEFRSRIFQRFAQANAADTRERGGTGLGLSISRAIVERHGGTIAFNDHPEGGRCSGSSFLCLALLRPPLGRVP
ncbi:ATP-binding protein [Deinococcus malanensis]|uniref:ATP-binding protein n=1 Tax=Deinococcus malanensis TaxID=1706855 RepID=UPI0036341067